MEVLEIDCNNDKCNCDCTIGQTQHFNMIFVDDLKLNKTFTCDNCEATILIVDEVLLQQIKSYS
tara:strand:- start:854 stop:1045 length:192 start_codon:yes stop_codon:yes gene_type:complete